MPTTTELLTGQVVTQAHGRKALNGVTVARFNAETQTVDAQGTDFDCDLLCVSGGYNPSVHLLSQSQGSIRYDESLATFVPASSVQADRSAGAANGTFELGAALREGNQAGIDAAAAATGKRRKNVDPPLADGEVPERAPLFALWSVPLSGRKS